MHDSLAVDCQNWWRRSVVEVVVVVRVQFHVAAAVAVFVLTVVLNLE